MCDVEVSAEKAGKPAGRALGLWVTVVLSNSSSLGCLHDLSERGWKVQQSLEASALRFCFRLLGLGLGLGLAPQPQCKSVFLFLCL